MVSDPDRWRLAFRRSLPTLVIAYLFIVLGQLVDLYGPLVLVYVGIAFLIIGVSIYVAYLSARISRLESSWVSGDEREEFEPPIGEEKARLRQLLQGALEEMSQFRGIEGPFPRQHRTKLVEWRRRTLTLLGNAVGESSEEYETFYELEFEPKLPLFESYESRREKDLDEAQAILKSVLEFRFDN